MGRLIVFNNVSLDGYFTDADGGMSFAHNPIPDPEWDAFAAGNAAGGGTLIFGRITYEFMASFWPTPAAAERMPALAQRMNEYRKIVFSRTLEKASWSNTTLVKGELVEEIRKRKKAPGEGLVLLGSGSLVAQLAPHGLIDEYQLAVQPLALGRGRTLFDGVKDAVPLKLAKTRSFKNGTVLLRYEPR